MQGIYKLLSHSPALLLILSLSDLLEVDYQSASINKFEKRPNWTTKHNTYIEDIINNPMVLQIITDVKKGGRS